MGNDGAPLDALLMQTHRLLASSRKAVSVSRASIAMSIARATSSEARRSACLPAPQLRDLDAAELLYRLRSALDQAVIDREVRSTSLAYGEVAAQERNRIDDSLR